MICCIPSRAEFIINEQMRELRRLALAAREEARRADQQEIEFRRRESERQRVEAQRAANIVARLNCVSLRQGAMSEARRLALV